MHPKFQIEKGQLLVNRSTIHILDRILRATPWLELTPNTTPSQVNGQNAGMTLVMHVEERAFFKIAHESKSRPATAFFEQVRLKQCENG
jgi:hypothetical protein